MSLERPINKAANANNVRVSVLVICYRMASTVADALRSALAQTVACEIIVSDDCGGDNTLDVAQAIVRDYAGPHRVVVRSTARNLGLCAHLAELAELASGDMLMVLAGDDIAYPERAECLLSEFDSYPAAQIVGSCVDDIDDAGVLLQAKVRGLPRRIDQAWLLRRGKMATVLGASMMVRRSLLTDFPPLRGRVEDNMLTLRGVLVGEVRCLPKALLGYRRHENNLGSWVFDRRTPGYEGWAQRQRRVLEMYREIAEDQQRCVDARPDLGPERQRQGRALAALYLLEAEQREVLLEKPRRAWVGPLVRGLCMPGLRRKSAERAFKLLLPRWMFGAG